MLTNQLISVMMRCPLLTINLITADPLNIGLAMKKFTAINPLLGS